MPDIEEIQASLDIFPNDFKSLIISSITRVKDPYASYAPFVKVKDDYYFIISKIAKHYENILNNPQITILLIEDESKASHIFFRKRLSYFVNTMFVEDEKVKYAFIEHYGEFAKSLFNMGFVMVKCNIIRGNYIIGAGQAYEVDQHQKIIAQMKGISGNGHSAD